MIEDKYLIMMRLDDDTVVFIDSYEDKTIAVATYNYYRENNKDSRYFLVGYKNGEEKFRYENE